MDERQANVVLTANTQQYSQQMTSAATQTNQVTKSVNDLITSLDKLSKNAGRKLELISAATVATITGATVAAGRFDSQLATLQATAVVTGRNFGPVKTQIDDLRRNLPVTTQQVVALAEALQKLGANPANLQKTADTLIKLAASTGEDLGQLATGMVDLQRAMGTTEDSMGKFADSLVQVSANLGVSATGVLQFSQSLAPIARTVGMTQKEVMGFSAAFLKSGQDGFTAANAFNKMLTDISRATRYGSTDLAMYANLVGKTVDEFKAMGSSEQMMALFTSINKAGPDAIKVLERMGLDGPRAMRAIQGLAQSGGLKQAMDEVNKGFGSGANAKAAQEAMTGLNDETQKLKNTLTSISQAFGQTFLPVAEGIVKAFGDIANVVRSVTGPVTGLIASLTAGGAGLAGLAGFALNNFGMLSTVAGGLMLGRSSLGAGFARGRQNATGRDPRSAIFRRSINSFEEGGGSRFQRAMYSAGQFAYGMSPVRAMDRANDRIPGRGLGLGARAAMLGSLGWQGAMGLARGMISPLEFSRVGDITRRVTGDASRMGQDWRAVRTGEGVSFGRAMAGAVASTGRFTASLASATAGLTRLAATTAGGMVGRAARGIGGGLMNLAGGPAGLALMAGVGGLVAWSDERASQQEFENRMSGLNGSDSQYNRYATALGLAGQAALSFSSTLAKAESQIETTTVNEGKSVRNADITAASVAGRQLTDPTIGNMTADQAVNYSMATFSNPSASPAILQAAKLDLIQKFKPEKAQQIIDAASNGEFRPYALLSGSNSSQQGFGALLASNFRTGQGLQDALATQQSSSDILRANVSTQFGGNEADKVTSASVNAILKLYDQNLSDPERTTVATALETALGGADLGIGYADQQRLTTASSDRQRIDRFRKIVEDSGNADAYLALQDSLGEQGYNMAYQMPDPRSVQDTPLIAAQKRTLAGQQFYSSSALGNTLTTAIQNEGDENAQLQAATQWAAELTKVTGTTTQANLELQRFKAAVGDPQDPLYALANSAQQAADRLQSYGMQYMSGPQQAQTVRDNLTAAYQSPDSPDREQRIMAAEDAYEQQRGGLFNRLKTIVRAYEDFDISQGRSREDFGISRGRQDYNQRLQVSRSNSDFARSRQRSDEDYDLQRRRQDEDYFLSLKRGWFDYNLSRQQSEYDFNLSRRRQEEDYQHQLVLMTRNTARQMQDIFQRITTVPTWDAQNLLTNAQDQNAQFRQQQQNLQQVRNMGVSSDVIKQLGLNDPKNAQQLARMVQDLAQDPSLVDSWNKAIKDRLSLADAFNKDKDNEAYTEMERQFKLTADRAVEDFNRMADRGAEAYNRSISRMQEDYSKMQSRMSDDYEKTTSRGQEDYARMMARNSEDYARAMAQTVADWSKQMSRAQADLNRSFEETTGTFEELSEKALSRMTGTAKDQLKKLLDALGLGRDGVKKNAESTASDLDTVYKDRLGLNFSKLIFDDKGRQVNGSGFNMRIGDSSSDLPATPGSMTPEGKSLLNPTTGESGGPAGNTMQSFPVMGQYRRTSGFGMRTHPITGQRRLHAGVDLAAAQGTGIAASEAGVVTHAGWYGGGGNAVRISHGNGFDTWYLHMSRIGAKLGQQVVGGQRIGDVGSTGNSTGPHLHFETRYNGSPKDPTGYLAGLPQSGYSAEKGGDSGNLTPFGLIDMVKDVVKAGARMEQAQFGMPGMSRHLPPGLTTMALAGNAIGYARENDKLGWFGNGAIFNKPTTIGVGERGAEAVLPLDAKGADFMAGLLDRFAVRGNDRAMGAQTVTTKTVTYNQHVDSSINYSGDITVQAQDPNEMGRKLEEKARLERLTKR